MASNEQIAIIESPENQSTGSVVGFEAFKARLCLHLRLNLDLVINENRSTMLSVLEKTPWFARLSIHKMFLDAPDPVILAIAHYVKRTRKDRKHYNLVLRTFIQEHLLRTNYTHLVNHQSLDQDGDVYQLKNMYEQINRDYFENRLHLSITWFGNQKRQRRARITYGQYLDGLRLIKIHRMLDNSFFPEYFVSFIIYHEMLHAVVPGHVDRKRGRYCFHSQEFKRQEKEFKQYHKAVEWEKQNTGFLLRCTRHISITT